MKKASAIVSFALAVGVALTGAAAGLAQPDTDDVFRPEDMRAVYVYSCSKDGALMKGVFFVTPSYSDMKKTGEAISWDILTPELNKAASGITSDFTVAELQDDPATNQVIDKNVTALQDAVEQKSEISLRVDELNFSPITLAEVEPAKRYKLPKCSGGNGGGGGTAPGRGGSQPGFGI